MNTAETPTCSNTMLSAALPSGLNVEHLAPYLPYGLTFLMESEPDSKEPNIDELKSIDVGLKMVNFGWGNA